MDYPTQNAGYSHKNRIFTRNSILKPLKQTIMASRRNLKKIINYISDFTVGLCIMAGLEKKDKRETVDQLIEQANAVRNEALKRISHTEPGSVKQFYKKLKEDFTKGTDAICNQLEALIKG